MAVYNSGKYLKEAIVSMLSQTFRDFEFIIINDGSTDNSLEILRSFSDTRIKIINHDHKGLSASLNIGLQVAEGEYIARMDADDISNPERLEKQFKFMTENKECVLSGSNIQLMKEDGTILITTKIKTNWEDIKLDLFNIQLPHPTAMYKKDIALKCGGYFEKIKHHFEDIILWNKMAEFGEIRNLEDVLLKYRLTRESISNKSKQQQEIINLICGNVIRQGMITEEDLLKLERITLPRSGSWKSSNYYYTLAMIYRSEKNFTQALLNYWKAFSHNPQQCIFQILN